MFEVTALKFRQDLCNQRTYTELLGSTVSMIAFLAIFTELWLWHRDTDRVVS